MSAFDLPLLADEGEDAISTVMAAVSKVAHEVHDKSTSGAGTLDNSQAQGP